MTKYKRVNAPSYLEDHTYELFQTLPNGAVVMEVLAPFLKSRLFDLYPTLSLFEEIKEPLETPTRWVLVFKKTWPDGEKTIYLGNNFYTSEENAKTAASRFNDKVFDILPITYKEKSDD